MLHTCAFCGAQCSGVPYVLGAVRGHLCPTHAAGLQEAVTMFAAKAMREQRAAQAAARKERLQAIRLAAEALPNGFGRAMRRKGEAA